MSDEHTGVEHRQGQRGRRANDSGWHVDKRTPAYIIVALALQLVGFGAGGGLLLGRVGELERNQERMTVDVQREFARLDREISKTDALKEQSVRLEQRAFALEASVTRIEAAIINIERILRENARLLSDRQRDGRDGGR